MVGLQPWGWALEGTAVCADTGDTGTGRLQTQRDTPLGTVFCGQPGPGRAAWGVPASPHRVPGGLSRRSFPSIPVLVIPFSWALTCAERHCRVTGVAEPSALDTGLALPQATWDVCDLSGLSWSFLGCGSH